jgi:uncharacterized membrane protein
MLVVAIGLGAFMVWLDAGPASGVLDSFSWYQKSKPEGAREVLSTIAGSMITVAGVVFSITIVAISFAANQYGPRILTNFMSDRGNQVTLGTFVATFAYAVVVLRTIHGGDSNFVPQLAVLLALLMALWSIAVLIYFIHHVPESIHINGVTARIGRQLLSSIEKEFPACFANPPAEDRGDEERLDRLAGKMFGSGGHPAEIGADSDGYLQTIDDDLLLSIAKEHDIVIKLEKTPGHFLFKGEVVAVATPCASLDRAVAEKVQGSWNIGSKRTPDQDALFLVDELVEIAARALSTGVNDPHTANTCVDWLAAAAARMSDRQAPSRFRVDGAGNLRVVAPVPDFRLHVERGFGQLQTYVAGDVNAATHAMSALASLSPKCRSTEQRDVLAEQLDALTVLARSAHQGPSRERIDREALLARLALVSERDDSPD